VRQFGALGDIHGDFEAVNRIMREHPDVPFWLSVGDLADDRGQYQAVAAPLYWIKGNNEDFDLLGSGRLPANLHWIPQAVAQRVHGISIAGLGGTLAPTWYDTPASDLPHPRKGSARATALADKRRHFVREEVETCKAMRGIDVFMSHEAPRPYFVGGQAGRRGVDAGKTPINEVLAAMRPRLHFFGHHHRFSEQERQGVRSIGLDLASKSYVLVDVDTFQCRQIQSGPHNGRDAAPRADE
jgi:Icc-related predicted phosphoesterase